MPRTRTPLKQKLKNAERKAEVTAAIGKALAALSYASVTFGATVGTIFESDRETARQHAAARQELEHAARHYHEIVVAGAALLA